VNWVELDGEVRSSTMGSGLGNWSGMGFELVSGIGDGESAGHGAGSATAGGDGAIATSITGDLFPRSSALLVSFLPSFLLDGSTVKIYKVSQNPHPSG
jgi:hypothetical protein